MELRPYQKQAIENIHREWEIGRDKTLLVLPTGCGKTVCFGQVAKDIVDAGGKPLVLAHRDELLEQADSKFRNMFGITCDISSIQSMCRDKRLNTFPQDFYSHIIIDEAHHVLSDSYQKVLSYFNAKVLGVTATPDRADKKNLGKFFDSIAYEFSMVEAVKLGYLSKIVAQLIPLQIDLTDVEVKSGDYDANSSAKAIEPFLEQIADEMVSYCKDRKTVVFLPLIETSKKFVEILNRKNFTATEVNGESKDREQILEDFANGKYNVLCNSMLLTEGWDCPSVDCVIVLRPTKSRALFQQMVGRGTRPSPGKENLLLLDFLWNVEKHSLCRPSCLVAKSESIAKKIDEKINSSEQLDLLEITEEAEQKEIKDKEQSLAEQLRLQRFKKKGMVDPIQFAFSIRVEDMVNYEPEMTWEFGPPSDKQLQALSKFGIDVAAIPNAGFASKLLDKCFARIKEGMSTAKQIRFLEARGFKDVGTWKNSEASEMITTIANNRWMVPFSIKPSEYVPKRS